MTLPQCPTCKSRAVSARVPDSPDVMSLYCRACGHTWEVQANSLWAEALHRLAPLPHWR